MNNKEIKVQLLCFIATHAETQTPTVRAQQEGNYTSSRPPGKVGLGGVELFFLHSIQWVPRPKFQVL